MGEKLALEKSRMSVGDSIQNYGVTTARSSGETKRISRKQSLLW